MIYCYRLCKRVFLCLHYRSDKQLLILTDKGLCLYNSSSLFLLWLPLGSSWALFAYYVPGGGGGGEGFGGEVQFSKRLDFEESILKMHRM